MAALNTPDIYVLQFWKTEVKNQGVNRSTLPLKSPAEVSFLSSFCFWWHQALLGCGHITPTSASVVTLSPHLLVASSGVCINFFQNAVWEITFCTSPFGVWWELKLVTDLESKRDGRQRIWENWKDLSGLQPQGKTLHYSFLGNQGVSPR